MRLVLKVHRGYFEEDPLLDMTVSVTVDFRRLARLAGGSWGEVSVEAFVLCLLDLRGGLFLAGGKSSGEAAGLESDCGGAFLFLEEAARAEEKNG